MKYQKSVDFFFDLNVAAHGQIDDGAGNVAGMDGVVDQSSGFGGTNALGRLVLRGYGNTRIGIASHGIPEGKHHGQGQQREEHNGITAEKPSQPREGGRRFEHSLRDINVDSDAPAHGKWVSGFEKNVGAFNFGGRFTLPRTVGAGEGLSAQLSGGIFGQGHEGGGMVDGNRPIVAGHVPVELGVIISGAISGAISRTVEKADAVANGVIDVDDAGGVDRAGNVDFEIPGGSGLARIVLQLASVFVGDAHDIEKERVVGSVRSGIFDRDGAVNAVPLTDESERNFFVDR